MTRSWFTAKATSKDSAEITIYDEIGLWGVTAKDFHDELKALGAVDHLDIRINSPGGEVFAGINIYNMLARHKATKTVTIDGIAASMASVVAMAGDTVIMPENAMMMIHDPAGMVIGTSKDMRDLAGALDKMKSGMMAAYAAKSGMDRDEVASIMTAETWLTAQEAVDMGFADAIEKPVKAAANFDLSKFKNAPADAGRKPRGRAAHNTASMEQNPMTETEKAAAVEAENKIKAEAEAKAKAAADIKAAADKAAQDAAAGQAGTAVADAVTAERKRAADIHAACQMVGKPDKAVAFISEGKSLSEVIAALQTDRAASADVSTRHNNADSKPANLDKFVDKVNARFSNGRAA